MSVLAGLMEAPIRKKPKVPSGHHHGPKPLHEMFSTFRSSHPSPKVCLPPINNQESMTSQLPDKAVPHHISAQANGFYFCIFGENHVSAFDNTNKGGKKKSPRTQISTPPPPSAQADLRQTPGSPICSSPAGIWVAATSNARLAFSHVGVCCLSDEAVCALIVLCHPEGFLGAFTKRCMPVALM